MCFLHCYSESVPANQFKIKRVLDSDSSDSSRKSSSHGFNYDSKYLIEVFGLPRSSARQDILNFFKDINILNGPNGIHFMTDEKDRKSGRAFIQLAQLKDFKLAHQYNTKYLGDHCITGNIKLVLLLNIGLKQRSFDFSFEHARHKALQ